MKKLSVARIWAGIVLLGLVSCILAMRAHTYAEPLDRDLTSFAVIGDELLNGLSLYTDLFTFRPPAIYATYAAANQIFGMGPSAVYFLGVTAAILALFGIYFSVRRARFSRAAALWAAAFWVALASDLSLAANQPNIEAFVNIFVIWGFALFVGPSKKPPIETFLAGACFGIAAVYDPLALVPFALVMFAQLVFGEGRNHFFKRIIDAVLACFAAVLPWAITLGYFFLTAKSESFLNVAAHYISLHATQFGAVFAHGITLQKVFPHFLYFCFPVLMILILGAALSRFAGVSRWILFFALAAGCIVEVLLREQLYPHHYQYWLPVLAIGVGFGLGAALEFCTPVRFGKLYRLPYLVAIGVFGFVAHRELGFFQVSAEDWSHMKYAEIFVESEKLGREIRKKLFASETFFNWGEESGLYYSSRLRPPTAMLSKIMVTNGPDASKRTVRVLDQLKAKRPVLLVVLKGDVDELKSAHPIAHWLTQNYTPLPSTNETGPFLLYGLNDSDFLKR